MISYEPPETKAVNIGDYTDGLGTVLDPDDEEMVALMENVAIKDDTDYINGDKYGVHAHLNACGTGELTVFVDPSEVTTLTLLKGDEMRHYDLLEKPTNDYRCSFCGETREDVAWLVQSPIEPCICDVCALQVIRLMLGKKAEK